jgi:hypothetical protein
MGLAVERAGGNIDSGCGPELAYRAFLEERRAVG